MKTPSLTRVKILKFMLSRIDEPVTLTEIEEGSHSNFTNTRRELVKLRNEKMITPVGKNYKFTFYNAEFITKKHTELALICDFKRIIKKVSKKLDK